MKAIKILFFAVVITAISFVNANGQNGDSCITPIPIVPDSLWSSKTYLFNNSSKWFSFVANCQDLQIDVTNPDDPTNTPAAHLHVLTLYSGNCQNLQIIEQKNIDLGNQLIIQKTGLTVGNTYYIEVKHFVSGCTTCQYINAFFSLHIFSFSASLPCPPKSCANDPIICNLIWNHSFEVPTALTNPTCPFRSDICWWKPSHGSPQVQVPGALTSRGAYMWTATQFSGPPVVVGEGIVTDDHYFTLTANQQYLLSYYSKVSVVFPDLTPLDNYYIRLLNHNSPGVPPFTCINTGTGGPLPGIPTNQQLVHATAYGNINWIQNIVCFSSTSSNWDQLWIYPLQNSGNQNVDWLHIDEVVLVPFIADPGMNQTISTCGASVTLGGPCILPGYNSSNPNNGPTTYQWTPATGLSCTNCPNPVASPNTTTTYTLTVIYNGSLNPNLTASSCTTSANVTVTVTVPSPPCSIGGPLTVCPNTNNISYTGPGPSASYTYLWSVSGNGSISGSNTNQTVSINSGNTGTYTVTLSITNISNNCTSTCNVTVQIGIGTITGNSVICNGQSTQLCAPVGMSNYLWSTSANTQCITVNPSSTSTYTVTYTDPSLGCTLTGTQTITVNPLPVIIVTGNTICMPTVLTASGANSYTWSPSTSLSSTTGPMVIANPTSPTTYTVIGTDNNGCTASTQVSLTGNQTPVLTITPHQFICLGQSITLTATGANSYAWSPGSSLNTTTGSSVIATPTVYTIYTVVGTSNGCTATATVAIMPVAPPNVSVTGNLNICIGSSTVLTASGANSYTWSPSSTLSSSTGSSVTATPTTTTTYTVTGTGAHNCTATTQVTVTVYPHPTVTLSGYTNTCVDLSSPTIYTATATGGSSPYSYSWSFTWGTGSSQNPYTGVSYSVGPGSNQITINNWGTLPSGNVGQYCVTVTDAHGCTASVCRTVYPCCTTPCAEEPFNTLYINNTAATNVLNTLPSNLFLPYIANGNKISTDKGIVINGIFNVNTNIIFEDCPFICLGPNAQIIIQPNCTLQLTSPGTHFYPGFNGNPGYTGLRAACGIMWDGIYLLNSSSHLIVDFFNFNIFPPFAQTHTIIQDAKNAIVSSGGGDFQIKYADLRQNNWCIKVNQYTGGSHSGHLSSSLLRKEYLFPMLPYYPTNTALTTVAALARTRTGIEINTVQDITIGDNSATERNIFSNMDLGIYNRQSKLTVINNDFNDINTSATFPSNACASSPCGYCIYAVNTTNPTSFTPGIIVGGSTSLANNFNNYFYGVIVRNKNFVDVGWNTFNNTALSTNLGRGIDVSNCGTNCTPSPIDIYNNTFEKFYLGVNVYDRPYSTINIHDNSFNPSYTTFNAGSAAIWVREPSLNTATSPFVFIETNTIKNINNGILITNLNGAHIGNTNTIIFADNHPTAYTSYGIRVQFCKSAVVESNLIYRCTYCVSMSCPDPPSPCWGPPAPNYNSLLMGISIEGNSMSNKIDDNQMAYLGEGIRCMSTNSPNTFRCNKMAFCQRGALIANANPGIQGSSTSASDNEWRRNASFQATYPAFKDVVGSGVPAGTPWYIRNSPGLPYTPSGGAMSPVNFINVQAPYNTATPDLSNPCSYVPQLTPPNPEDLQTDLKKMLDYTLDPNCPLDAQSKFLTQLNVYIELVLDNSLMYLGTPNDIPLQNFYTDATNTNIGAIAMVKFYVSEGDRDGAEEVNSTITPDNQAVANEKAVNAIYLATWAKDIYEFSTAQNTTLNAIASQNPFSGGTAVYGARVLLGIDYPDNIPIDEERLAASSDDETEYFKVFPNPANDEVNISYYLKSGETGIFTMSDLSGRQVLKQEFSAGENSISLSTKHLEAGIYFVSITMDNELVGTEKLLIIR